MFSIQIPKTCVNAPFIRDISAFDSPCLTIVMRKVKQSLSILLAVAMVVTCVPQTGLSVLAAPETKEGTTDDADIIVEDTADDVAAGDETATDAADDATADDTEVKDEILDEGGETDVKPEDEGSSDTADEDSDLSDTDESEDESTENEEETDVDVSDAVVDESEEMVTAGDVTVTLPTDRTGYSIEGEATVTAGTDYTFTVTPDANYNVSVKVKIGETETPLTAGDDGKTYTVAATLLTEDVTEIEILITAEKKTASVTIEKSEAGVETVEYQKNGETSFTTWTDGVIEVGQGDELKLKVTPAEGYTAKVTVGDSEDGLISVEGVYAISVTESTTIKITAAKITYSVGSALTKMEGVDVSEIVDFRCSAIEPNQLGKIEAGKDLTFTVKLKEGKEVDYRIKEIKVTVNYDVQGGGQAFPVDLKDNGEYTFSAEKITGNILITITAEELPSHKVTFTKSETLAGVTDITVGGKPADPAGFDSETTGNWEISGKEGSEVKFKLTIAEFYKVADNGVTYGNDVIEADKNGVYTVVIKAEDTALNVETALDEAQCYGLSFGMAEGSDAASAKMKIEIPDGETDFESIAGLQEDGYKVKTRAPKVIVSFEAVEGFELGAVTVNGKEAVPMTIEGAADTDPKKYEVVLEKGKDTAVAVATTPKASEKASNVKFNLDGAANMELVGVKVDGKDVGKDDETSSYLVAAEARRVTFSLRAKGPYAPTVTNDGNVKVTESKDGSMYNYSVLARDLPENGVTFTVTQAAIMNTITFAGDDIENVTISASVNGRLIAAENDGSYEVLQGTQVTLNIAKKNNCELAGVTSKIGSAKEKTEKVSSKTSASIVVTVTDNTVVTIKANALKKAAPVKDSQGNILTPVKNVYNVSYDGAYEMGILVGDTEEPNLAITAVEIKAGKTAVDTSKDGLVSGLNQNSVTVDLSKAVDDKGASLVAGQKLTITLKAGTDSVAYTFNVSKKVSDIKISNKAEAVATQSIDTTKEYPVKTDGEIGKLVISVNDEGKAVVDADSLKIVNGKLVVTTKAKAGEALITISSEGTDKTATLKLTAAPVVSTTTAAPGVTLKSATDVALIFALSDKKVNTALNSTGVYYEVTATPEIKEGRPEGLKEDATVQYIRKTGNAQDATIVVGNSDKQGTGGAWNYDVKVKLVHLNKKDAVLGADAVAEGDILGVAGKEFATKSGKPFSTQKPAYEAALKLKKGTTSIYTGQSDVLIATPQFTKTTTYTEITEDDVKDLTAENALTFEVRNGQIYASAQKGATLGKHKIQVTAKADTDNKMYASTAVIDITVVQGIDEIEVSIPSDKIFKAPGKAGSLKASAVYCNGNGTITPKTKKVGWEIVDENGNKFEAGDPRSKIGIKNGTVTVDKNYQLALKDDDNVFYIKAIANDFKGNEMTTGLSDAITITNAAINCQNIAVIDANSKVVAIPDSKKTVTIEASKLNDASIVVLNEAPELNDVVTEDDCVAPYNLTFKSANVKNLTVYEGGLVKVKKVGKTKVTVTAQDGGKSKYDLTLNVVNDKTVYIDGEKEVPQELGIKISDTVIEDKYEYAGSAVNCLYISVMARGKADSDWESAADFGNYTLTIGKGQGKLTQTGNIAELITDKQVVTLTLTDKSFKVDGKNKEYKYTLINTSYNDEQFKFTAKPAGKLYQWATGKEQNVTINLSGLKDTDYAKLGENGIAMVEVDLTAMTDANASDLFSFSTCINYGGYEIKDYNSSKKTANFVLNLSQKQENEFVKLNQKSYKLKVTLGKIDGDSFVPVSQAATVTVSVDKAKAFTFKPTTSYKLSTRDGYVQLTGKANIADYNVEFTELLNANEKGEVNAFTDTFELSDNRLTIKDTVDVASLHNKSLTGYVKYRAYATKSYYADSLKEDVAKITVKIDAQKAISKYAVSGKPEIGNIANQETEVKVTANKNPVRIAYVVLDPAANQASKVKDWEASVNNGKVVLKVKNDLVAEKSFTVPVIIVPEGSYYVGKIDKAPEMADENGAKTKAELTAEYGIKLNISVKTKKVVDPVVVALDEAKKSIETWCENITAPAWLKNGLTADGFLAELQVAVSGASLPEGVTVAVAKGANDTAVYTLTPASLAAAGKIEATLEISVGEGDAVKKSEVSVEIEVPTKAITKDEAKNAVESADNDVAKLTLSNEDVADDEKIAATQEKIISKAQELLGEGYYVVSVAGDNDKLKVTKAASESEKGSASVTLTIKEQGNDTDTGVTVQLTYELPLIENTQGGTK